jgi:hypothetical protein
MTTLRSFLKLIYFVTGGPVLAVFAFFALKQIEVSKQAIRIAAKRDSFRLAAEQAHIFATELVPIFNELDQIIQAENIEFFNSVDVSIDGRGFLVKKTKPIKSDEILKIAPCSINIMDRMETLAIFFTSKVADEYIAFTSIGPTYVRQVKLMLPLMLPSITQRNHVNALKLFILWNERLQKLDLERVRESIERKLDGMSGREIFPIGVSEREING